MPLLSFFSRQILLHYLLSLSNMQVTVYKVALFRSALLCFCFLKYTNSCDQNCIFQVRGMGQIHNNLSNLTMEKKLCMLPVCTSFVIIMHAASLFTFCCTE